MPKQCKGHQKPRFRKFAPWPKRASKNIIKASKNTSQKRCKHHAKSTYKKGMQEPKGLPKSMQNQQNTWSKNVSKNGRENLPAPAW
jgi:hypothetical protein